MARLFALDAEILSIDLEPPTLRDDDRVTFLQGDAERLDRVFGKHDLFSRPRPWMVIEDSAHTHRACLAALEFFREHLQPGELLVIEDGVLVDLGMSEKYSGGPNRAIAEFFGRWPDEFEVATEYTDMFGVNATYNPNGYLRRK